MRRAVVDDPEHACDWRRSRRGWRGPRLRSESRDPSMLDDWRNAGASWYPLIIGDGAPKTPAAGIARQDRARRRRASRPGDRGDCSCSTFKPSVSSGSVAVVRRPGRVAGLVSCSIKAEPRSLRHRKRPSGRGRFDDCQPSGPDLGRRKHPRSRRPTRKDPTAVAAVRRAKLAINIRWAPARPAIAGVRATPESGLASSSRRARRPAWRSTRLAGDHESPELHKQGALHAARPTLVKRPA